MMDPELSRAVAALSNRLVAIALHDDALRDELRAFATAILAATERPASVSTSEPTDRTADADVVAPPQPKPKPARPREPLPELTLGRVRPPETRLEPGLVYSTTDHDIGATRFDSGLETSKSSTADAELAAIEARCRFKAEGLRWALMRRKRSDQGADFRTEIAPGDRDILDRANRIDCYLWMNKPDFTIPVDPRSLENAVGCFEATADGLAVIRGMLPDHQSNRHDFESALNLLAEAQSALRSAIDRIGGPVDQDQFQVYDWLRGVAKRESIYVQRYMKLDDPASPEMLPEIKRRIDTLAERSQTVGGRARKKKSAFSRLRYHAKRVAQGGTEGDHDWQKIAGAIGELVDEGEPPSSVEIREVMLPIVDLMPELAEVPAGFTLFLRELDHYLSGRTPTPEDVPIEVHSSDVSRVARLLSGRAVVLIGGYRRLAAGNALKEAFGLTELIWLEGRDHSSTDRFEPSIARSDVAVVLLAIRWSSHSFGDVRHFCVRYDKPLVRLKAGYSPNQVAAQILNQCSEQLERTRQADPSSLREGDGLAPVASIGPR